MSHTPLFSSLRRSFLLARLANRGNESVSDLLARRREHAISRRIFLRQAAIASIGAAGAGLAPGCILPRRDGLAQRSANVAIVGAGLAGLNAAYQLRRNGVRATVYEASNRIGGRVLTATDLLGEGLTTELGGEFIDSNHEDLLTLARSFRLELLDMNARAESDLIQEAYFFDERHVCEAEVIKAFQPLAARMEEDLAAVGDTVDYQNEGGAATLDRMSLADYLNQRGEGGFLRDLLDVAYTTEYGLDCGEQSALNLLFLIGTNLSDSSFELFGESDERYKIAGGNQRITDELGRRLKDQIELGHRLLAVGQSNSAVTLDFEIRSRAPATTVVADFAILAVPFTLLRDVEWRTELSPRKRRAINELGYGTNAKLLVGQSRRPWQERGFAGAVLSDHAFQLAWDNSRMQGTPNAGLTIFTGGKSGIEVGAGSASEQVDRLLPGVDRAFPGVSAARTGVAHRFHWPTHPWTRGSYSCYRPGQWTSVAGLEAEPIGNIFFAGEHCSRRFQGFMNGAAESGRLAAGQVLSAARATQLA